ncbi:YopT-type cysteine protease domain-containing protein [Paraburkholderia azotifigens]|uniref:YopT-type cysteine protease domain-containing protein n=1 Tax=Paraburkholderia azotifigens TaxID=2057004 RepID=A0A5C6VFA6_9BURK|nr:YopT-type cysteine protease domain-containing protein [Paraburkholderia azotifigens]TXC83660.1 hypothetical protein FRZ40_25085 [Paraburkholderia azotifigens]
MPHVYDVMVATQRNYTEVCHTFFAQGEYKWVSMFEGKAVERKKGVCNGLCLRWIKSAHQTELIKIISKDAINNDKKPDAIRASVVRIQEKSPTLNKEPFLPSRKYGGFGSVAVTQISDLTYFIRDPRYPNEVGIECSNQSKLRKKVAQSIAKSGTDYKSASIINMTPESPSEHGHAVAVVASPGRVRFFDPNGGVLEFKHRYSFRKWFETDFGTISFYGEPGTTFQVINYLYAEEKPR